MASPDDDAQREQFDDHGWALVPPRPMDCARAYTLLSPEASSRIDEGVVQRQARRFFRAELALVTPKLYPGRGWPQADLIVVAVGALGAEPSTRVRLITLPLERVPAQLAAARDAAAAMGDAGFGALLDRAQRSWQIACEPVAGDERRAPLVLTAVLSSWLLAPVLPPEGGALFGVKGAQRRLTAAGWKI
jgi:hypothetical protein